MLVHAAAGGVGHLAVQIAKHLGAHVTATGNRRNHDWLAKIGADEVVDHTTTRFEDAVDDIDVVMDLAGDSHDDTSTGSLDVLRPRRPPRHDPGRPVPPSWAAAAQARGLRATAFSVEPDGTALTRIAELIDAGEVTVEVAEVFELEDVAEAHTRGETGHTRGKLVLRVTPQG